MSSEATRKDSYPPLTRADNFFDFWEQTLNLLNSTPSAIEITDSQETNDGLLLKKVIFKSLDNASIHGYLLTPKHNKSAPLIVYTHGYMGHCEVIWTWAKQGASVFGIDIRGFGKSQSAVSQVSTHGYVLTGIESEKTCILRGAVCDYIRGIQVANELLHNKQQATILYGKSFGGALACMATALTSYADFLVAAVPTFAWAQGRRKLVTEGSGEEINKFIKYHPDKEYQIMQVLSYFDTMNFAPLIKSSTLIGVGLQDSVVPAETVYAFINHLNCSKQVREFPVSHSSFPEEALWNEFEKEWMQLVISGKY